MKWFTWNDKKMKKNMEKHTQMKLNETKSIAKCCFVVVAAAAVVIERCDRKMNV